MIKPVETHPCMDWWFNLLPGKPLFSIKGSAAEKVLTKPWSGRKMPFRLFVWMDTICRSTETWKKELGKRIYSRPVTEK